MDEDDKYTRITLRIPKDLDKKLSVAANDVSRSKNAEIVTRLASTFQPPQAPDVSDARDALTVLQNYLSAQNRN